MIIYKYLSKNISHTCNDLIGLSTDRIILKLIGGKHRNV